MNIIQALLILFTLGLAVAAIGLTFLAIFGGRRRMTQRMAVAIFTFAALVVIADIVMAVNLRHRMRRAALHVELLQRSGMWEARYPTGASTTEMHVPAGELVEIASSGDPHLLFFPGTALLGVGRHRAQWLMQINDPAFFRGRSLVKGRHPILPIAIVAESRADFDRWLAHETHPATLPAGADAIRGQGVFYTARCAYCHVVRGIWQRAEEAAPDLTHLASRKLVAARLPNQKGYLAGWIIDPQSVDPATSMPKNAIDPKLLNDLMAFLETLK